MKTWDDWSDLDINIRVAETLRLNFEVISEVVIASIKHGGDNVTSISGAVDYCNNPTDMWPLIVAQRININAYEDPDQGWFATTDTSFFVDHTNPLRAAAIVFLMMNGVKL